MNAAEAARAYLARGWRPIAIWGVTPDGHCCCPRGQACPSGGKHPIRSAWQSDAEVHLEDFQDGVNVGLVTGPASGIFVLDLDTQEGLNALLAHGELTKSYTVRTGGGGWQIYYAMPDFEVTNRDRMLPRGVDIRGAGGQVVAPPSRSYKGDYALHLDVPVEPAPGWLLELLRPSTEPSQRPARARVPRAEDRPQTVREAALEDAIVTGELARLDELPQPWYEGAGWDATIFAVCCQLIELANSPWSRLTHDEAQVLVEEHAPTDEGWSYKDIDTKWKSATRTVGDRERVGPHDDEDPTDPLSMTYIPPNPALPPGVPPLGNPAPAPWPKRTWDDIGSAERMVDHFGQTLRWVDEAGQWAAYADGRWEMGLSILGEQRVQELVNRLPLTEALSYSDVPPQQDEPSERDKFLKWAKGLRMQARINACVNAAKAQPAFQATIASFDSESMLLNTTNCVIDLRTGAALPHHPAYMMRHQCPVAYDPYASAPKWDRFLARSMPSPEMRDYLQRACGYSATGRTDEQALFLHHGPSANGKSQFLDVMAYIFGPYGQTVPRETLLAKGQSPEHPTAIARMVGKRFLQLSETVAGRRLDEEIVKSLTGGDAQTARYMGKDFFDFKPTGKIHYVTNHLPRLSTAESIWRRMHLFGWNVVIPEHERIPNLGATIAAEEAPGVLAWVVRGTLAWQRHKLNPPVESREDLKEYRLDQDEFAGFIRQSIRPAPGVVLPISMAYSAYRGWSTRNGDYRAMTQPVFTRVMRERDFEMMGDAFVGITVVTADAIV